MPLWSFSPNKISKNAQTFNETIFKGGRFTDNFKRAFAVTLAAVLLLLLLVFSFELINKTVIESGFSSGEVLSLDFEKTVLNLEFLGRKLSLDFSALSEIFERLFPLKFLFPPFMRLGFSVIKFIFKM